ncbi:MAG: ABC transporter substrate-binding protein [Dehalococcoidia bacterium]
MIAKQQTWWLVAMLLALLLAAGAACSDNKNNGGSDEDTPVPSATEDVSAGTVEPSEIVTRDDVLHKDPGVTKTAEVDWGWLFELTGPPQIQVFGQVTGDGVKLAVDEINKDCTSEGICGFQVGDTIYKINLIDSDTQSDVARTVSLTTKLIRDDHVKVIWGPATLGEAEATQLTQPNKVLHLCPCQDREHTSLDTFEKAAGESHWEFQTLPAISRYFLQGAQGTREDFPELTKVAILCINTEIGQSVCGFYEDAYREAGFEIVGREEFPPGTTDYTPFLTRLRSKQPDILLNFDDAAAQINLLLQAIDLDVGEALQTSLTPDLLNTLLGPDKVRQKIFLAGGIPRQAAQPTSQAAADYFERYQAFSGGELPPASFVSMLTYDFVYMVIASMQQANTVDDTTAIADRLEVLHYAGAAEDDIHFDNRHISVMGSDSCPVIKGVSNCVHDPPPPPAP